MLLYITILGFIVTLLIFINLRQSNKVNIYLLFYLLINNIYALSHYATVYSGNKNLIAIMLVHFTPFYLMLGPLFYFYIRGLLKDDYNLSKWDLIHFVPALLFLINILPYVIKGWDYKLNYASDVVRDPQNFLKIDYLFMPSIISFLTRPIIAIVYLVLSFRLIIIKGLEFKNESIQAKLIYKWLLLLISVSLILYLGFLLFTFMSFYLRTTNLVDNSGVLILYATIAGLFTLNLSLLFFPNILYGLPQLDYAIVTKQNKVLEQELGIAEDFKKQAKGFEISTEKLNLLKLKVDEYIIKKPYLNSAFNLTMMSNDTDIPVHHLSYFFNEHIKVNFNSWKNNLKIDYVLEKINEGTNEILTLDALSKQAGFGSRSSFFIAFKQKMGVTPTEYIQSID